MLGRRVGEASNINLFKNVSHIFKNSDISFANLECVLCEGLEFIENKKYTFATNKGVVNILKDFNILSLANNHIIDCKEQGIYDTIEVLKNNNISFIGINNQEKLFIIEKEDIKIGFLAYCKKVPFFKNLKIHPYLINNQIIEDVKNAKKETDFLIVSLHWGKEYKKEPSEEQEKLARLLIDSGVDLIIGHHSHVIQKIEKYKQGLIAYSLGNFIFDQKFSERVKRGRILKVTLNKNKIKEYKVINTYINDNFEPIILEK